jgi:cutinase
MDDAINRLNKQNKECPDQTFAIVGYSQGAGVWHSAMGPSPGRQLPLLPLDRPKLDESVLPKIKAAVMFGDPGFKGNVGPMGIYSAPFSTTIKAVLRQNCGPGDPVILSTLYYYCTIVLLTLPVGLRSSWYRIPKSPCVYHRSIPD